jgi:hypothetical protein
MIKTATRPAPRPLPWTAVWPEDSAGLASSVWDVIRDFTNEFCADDVLGRLHSVEGRWHRYQASTAQRRSLIADVLIEFAGAGRLTITDRRDRQAVALDAKPGTRPSRQTGPFYRVAAPQARQPVLQPRPEPVAFYAQKLNVQIPATHDGLWALIRWFGSNADCDTVPLSDLVAAVRETIDATDVRAYCRMLERAGVLSPVLSVPDKPRFRVDLSHIETPRLRTDGSLQPGPQRHAVMWRSIKMLGLFTAENLAVAASLPDLAITPAQAARYADDLTAGGYLISQSLKLYRLKPGMNTGPAAPRVLRARFIWDANLCRIMGATSVDEVRS